MIPAPRRLALLEAGKLKLAAKARLAEGGSDARYEAAVLYHAAARAERRVLLAMEAPSPEARLASAIERCACLIQGFDVSEVLDTAWAEVLVASSAVDEKTATAMRARIDTMMSRFVERYRGVVAKMPPYDGKGTKFLHRELARFLEAFPGDAYAWASQSVACLKEGDVAAAWSAIRRARELAPEEASFIGWELRLTSRYLPRAEAEARLAEAYPEIERGEAHVDTSGGFVFAAVELATSSRRRGELLRQALTAAMEAARAAPAQSEDRKTFRAMELMVREMLAGRKPGLEILYRCGLGQLAAKAREEADPMDLLRARTTPVWRLAA